MNTDLDDTSGCPHVGLCEGCGATDDVATCTVGTPLGVYCLRLCVTCGSDLPPMRLGWAGVVERVLTHCGHLGITVDDMAHALDTERAEEVDD